MRFNGAAIYRSRNLARQTYDLIYPHALQWGRDLSIAELRRLIASRRDRISLQWGRDLSIAEFKGLGFTSGTALIASMGPRSIDRGIGSEYEYLVPTHATLQWGRDLSIAELRLSARSHDSMLGFNGAAIYRSRN